jgi:hypothetical protein
MTIKCLQDTGCAIKLKSKKSDADIGPRVTALLSNWREMAEQATKEHRSKVKQENGDSKPLRPVKQEKEDIQPPRNNNISKPLRPVKQENVDTESPCSSSTAAAKSPQKLGRVSKKRSVNDFEAQLLNADRVVPTKKKCAIKQEHVLDAEDVLSEIADQQSRNIGVLSTSNGETFILARCIKFE